MNKKDTLLSWYRSRERATMSRMNMPSLTYDLSVQDKYNFIALEIENVGPGAGEIAGR